jgi:NTE family protein
MPFMTKPPASPAELKTMLHRVPLLADLPDALLSKLAEVARQRDIARGEVLVTEGEAAETLYFILSGRFVVRTDAKPIAELAAGEPIGEIAFFAGGTRSATVSAMRASQVLELGREDYAALSRDMPELSEAVIRALARRVVSGNPRRAQLEPRAGTTICLRPVTGDALPEGFAARLLEAPAMQDGVEVIGAPDAVAAEELTARVHRAEAEGRRVLLIVEDAGANPEWSEAASAVADTVLLVASPGRAAQAPDAAEARLLASTLPQHLHLAILRESAAQPITGTAAVLAERPVGLHHHVALDRADDFARVARFLTGTATGLIFSGGAAYGTAHLGMLKALNEYGYVFDIVGGSSMGSAMAGGCAMGLDPDEVMDMIDALFLKSGAMKRYTAPVWSVIDHTFLDRELKRLTKGLEIEDLPLPYFAIATSLTRNDLHAIRSGPLWRAIRASSAIPAVFPPMVLDDGEVLIDGGLMDNAPLGPMRDLKPGLNVVMNIVRAPDWRVKTPYAALPGRGGAIRRMVLPFLGRKVRRP